MEEIIKIIGGTGLAGAILAYHLWKHATALEALREGLRKIEEAMDRSAQTDLIRLIASPHVAPEVKEAATTIVNRIKDAEEVRKIEGLKKGK